MPAEEPNMGQTDFEFSHAEARVLRQLRSTLKQVAEWPPESPLSFVLTLAPRTRGKLGEMLLKGIAEGIGLSTTTPESVAYDLGVGSMRCEAKFSTEDPPRFQQVRDPRVEDKSTKYDYLVCISGRPHGLNYWLIPAGSVGELMDDGHMTVQHAMSDTKWFLPSRTESDAFSGFRHVYEDFAAALVNAAS